MAVSSFLESLISHGLEKGAQAGEKLTRGGVAATDLLIDQPKIIPGITKLKEDEEPELFARILGIPTPFMQLGTYLGIEGWKGLAVDIVADPLNFIGGFGGLTKSARGAGKIARALEGSEAAHAAIGAGRVARAEEALKVAHSFGDAITIQARQADLLREIGFKAASAEKKAGFLDFIGKRSAQLDTYGHRRVLDFLSQAENEAEAIKYLDTLELQLPREKVVETTQVGTMRQPGALRKRTFETGIEQIGPRPSGLPRTELAPPGFTLDEAKRIAKRLPGSSELAGIRNRVVNEGLEAAKNHVRDLIDTRETLGRQLARFAEVGDAKSAMQTAKAIEKLEPNRAYKVLFGRANRKAWTGYFQELEKATALSGAGAKVTPLARTAEEQIAKGQRNLLTFQIPFFPGTEKVIATGAPILMAGLEFGRAAKGLLPFGKVTEEVGTAIKGERLPGLEVGKDIGRGEEAMIPAHSLDDVVLEYYPVPDTLYHFTPEEFAAKELKPGEDNIIWFTGNKEDNPLVSAKAREMAEAGIDIPAAERKWRTIPAKQGFKKLLEIPGRILETPEMAPKLDRLKRWANMGIDALVDPERPEWFGYIGHLRGQAKAGTVRKVSRLLGPKLGAYAGAGISAAAKAGAFEHGAAYDTVTRLGDEVIRHVTATGLGIPESVDDISKQYYGSREAAKDLAAAMGDEVRAAARGKDDALRLALDEPVSAFKATPQGQIPARNFRGGFTQFSKGKMKAGGAFDDLDIALMQSLERFHVQLNDKLKGLGLVAEPIENYIPRITKARPGKEKEYEAFLKKIGNPKIRKSHFKKRSIPYLREAFEAEAQGILEVEHDIGKLYSHMTEEVVSAAARKRLHERIRGFRIDIPNVAASVPLGVKKNSKWAKAHPDQWVTTINPHIIKVFYPKKPDEALGITEMFLNKKYAKDIEILFGEGPLTAAAGIPKERKIVDSLEKLNAVGKRSVLGSDAVTYGWMAERAGGTLGRQWLDSPIAMTRMGAYHRARATDVWKTAMEAGLRGNPLEQDLDSWNVAMDTAANFVEGKMKIPVVGPVMRGWRKAANAIEGPAWKYFHPSSKMTAFSELYSRALFDPRFNGIPMKEIAQGVAAHVNNAFSGLPWERMWLGGAGQKWLRLLMIAPDWTFSTIRLGADLFANQVARVPFLGRDMVAPAVRAAYARDYALRAGILTFGLMELANLATSSDPVHFLKTGQLNGHYMSENEEGHRAQLQLPVTEDGKKLFWVPQKQWQDFSDLANVFDSNADPFKFFSNRMGLVPNAFNTVILGRDSFGYPIVSTKDGFLENTAKRLAWIPERNILPSWTQTILGLGSANPRPVRGALEFGLSVRTGREVEPEDIETPQEVIDLRKEQAPPPDPIPPEFEQALQEELRTNPSYIGALNEHQRRIMRNAEKESRFRFETARQ